ncbi:MAG: hypothetical protein A2V72_02100 [Candidatus Nealsonbacteria bacterium RBG_13_37_56]|uniref:Uncharacterized protein n=1 Tax=Candidatus Nealsonbacteria bacterium RBG_13_37_56 TaxID=1801661 RepID=A0A1G2DZA3_9BACT|nr:MAG: hypothetical protein A2V72_02100 [Candidatus Nealsonbacteria bacterium RBG_13_37_56]
MANSSVKTNDTSNISKAQIRSAVIEVIREILDDPDYGLELTPYIVRRLKESLKSKKEGRLISFEEIKNKYQDKNK